MEYGLLGYFNSSTSVVTVDGENSSWNVTSTLQVAYGSKAAVTVKNGASLTNQLGLITYFEDAVGEVNVDGAGSQWTLDRLRVGSSFSDALSTGSAALNISGGGAVNSATRAEVEVNGTVEIREGTLVSPTIANSGIVHNDGLITGDLTGFAGSMTYGYGSLDGTLRLNNGSSFSAGNGVGVFTAGAAFLGSASYLFEIDEATATAGLGWDLLNIDGQLTISASVALPVQLRLQSLGLDRLPAPVDDFTPGHDWTWMFAHADGGIVGFAPEKFSIDSTGFGNPTGSGEFRVIQVGVTDIAIQFVVPETSSIVLAGAGLIGIWQTSRRSCGRIRTVETK